MRVAVEPILLACCAVEVATALRRPDAIQGIDWVADDGSRDVTVVVIAGTITTAAIARVSARIEAIRGPRSVIAFGVCASSGGPYWDSHAVAQGWETADLFVPGCPPPPTVLWSAIAQAAQVAVDHAAR
jgi:NADH-quinone oxidoreductase subunit B